MFEFSYELADVPRPGIGSEQVKGFRVKMRESLPLASGHGPQVKHCYRFQIFRTLPKCENMDFDDCETIVKVTPEGALLYQQRQRNVGCGYDPDVNPSGLKVTDPLELFVLDYTKKLRLKMQR